MPYVWKGDFEKGIPLLERCIDILQTWRMPLQFPFFAPILGYAYAHCGRLAEALRLLEQGVEVASSSFVATQSFGTRHLSEAYLLTGRRGEARGLAERALALAEEHGQRGDEAWALWLLGEIAAQADPPDVKQAETYYRQALTLADELGMRPLVAHCHLGLGTLDHKIGRVEQAPAELATAAEMYRAMEMTFWLATAEAALAQVNA
jgi:tetratricopeptide (TPR) repeat protein